MSALDLAIQIKQKRLEEEEKEKYSKRLRKKQDARNRKFFKDILEKVLHQFNGINEIELLDDNGTTILKQNNQIILKAHVGSYTFENPNVDYKLEETRLGIHWECVDREKGHNSSEEQFIENISRVLSKYI